MPAAKPTAAPESFAGFPPEAVQFFRDIEKNNTKDWYDAHAEDYKRLVITPAQAFIAAHTPRLRQLSPGVQSHPDPNGKGSIKKIQTDRRFNPGREPYKTYLEMLFWEGPLAIKKENSGFYFRFDPNGMVYSAGLKYFERPTLAAYRAAVLDPTRGAALDKALRAVQKAGYNVGGSGAFKKLPPGMQDAAGQPVIADHPRAALLLHGAIYAFKRVPLAPVLHSAELLDTVLAEHKLLAALHKWCVGILSQ